MDVRIIHVGERSRLFPAGPGGGGDQSSLRGLRSGALQLLLDALTLERRLLREGYRVRTLDGSFRPRRVVHEALGSAADPLPRVVIVHLWASMSQAALEEAESLIQGVKEEGGAALGFGLELGPQIVTGAFSAGADLVSGCVEGTVRALRMFDLSQTRGSETWPRPEALSTVPGVTAVSRDGQILGWSGSEHPRGGLHIALAHYRGVDLKTHLSRSKGVLPVRVGHGRSIAPSPTHRREGRELGRELGELARRQDVRQIEFLDPDFATNRVFALGVALGLAKTQPPPWTARVGARHVDRRLIEALAQAGAERIILTLAGKPKLWRGLDVDRPEDIERVARIAHSWGIEVEVRVELEGADIPEAWIALEASLLSVPGRIRWIREKAHAAELSCLDAAALAWGRGHLKATRWLLGAASAFRGRGEASSGAPRLGAVDLAVRRA